MAGMQHSSTQHITNTHPVPCMTPCKKIYIYIYIYIYVFTFVVFGLVQILLTIVVFVCFTWFVFSWFTGYHGYYLLDSHGFPLVSTAPLVTWVPTDSHGVSPVSHFGKLFLFLVFQLHWVCVCVCVVGDYASVFWCSGWFGGWPWQQRVWWQDCLNMMFVLEHACVRGVQGD